MEEVSFYVESACVHFLAQAQAGTRDCRCHISPKQRGCRPPSNCATSQVLLSVPSFGQVHDRLETERMLQLPCHNVPLTFQLRCHLDSLPTRMLHASAAATGLHTQYGLLALRLPGDQMLSRWVSEVSGHTSRQKVISQSPRVWCSYRRAGLC